MWIYNPETELYHYGVKGMKWGIRRKRNTSLNGKKQSMKRSDFVSEYQKERNRQKKYLATKRAIDMGSRFVNNYATSRNMTLNGKNVGIPNNVKLFVNTMLKYKYMNDTFK